MIYGEDKMNDKFDKLSVVTNKLSIADTGVDGLNEFCKVFTAVIGENWGRIENIPATFQAEDVKISADRKEISIGKLRYGFNIIPK